MLIPNIQLTNEQYQAIHELHQICSQHDKFSIRMYWDILEKPRLQPCYYVCYHEKKLIAYLSYFLFEPHAVHIAAMVHPDFRRQHYFTQLFENAKQRILSLGYQNAIFSIPSQNQIFKEKLIKQQAKPLQSEYFMEQTERPKPQAKGTHSLHFRVATPNDLNSIIQIDLACFKGSASLSRERFQAHFNQSERLTFLALLDHSIIGKSHVHFINQQAFIHDIAILPAFQGQGIGTNLLNYTLQAIYEQHSGPIALEVVADNTSALSLYEKCGFSLKQSYELFSLRIKP